MYLSCLHFQAWSRRSGERRKRRSQTMTTRGGKSGDTQPRHPRSSTPMPLTTRVAWCCHWSLPSGRSFHYCSVCVNFKVRRSADVLATVDSCAPAVWPVLVCLQADGDFVGVRSICRAVCLRTTGENAMADATAGYFCSVVVGFFGFLVVRVWFL